MPKTTICYTALHPRTGEDYTQLNHRKPLIVPTGMNNRPQKNKGNHKTSTQQTVHNIFSLNIIGISKAYIGFANCTLKYTTKQSLTQQNITTLFHVSLARAYDEQLKPRWMQGLGKRLAKMTPHLHITTLHDNSGQNKSPQSNTESLPLPWQLRKGKEENNGNEES